MIAHLVLSIDAVRLDGARWLHRPNYPNPSKSPPNSQSFQFFLFPNSIGLFSWSMRPFPIPWSLCNLLWFKSYDSFFAFVFLARSMPNSGSFSIQIHTTFIQNLLKISSFIPFHNILTKKLKKLSNPISICMRFCCVDSPSPFGFILRMHP